MQKKPVSANKSDAINIYLIAVSKSLLGDNFIREVYINFVYVLIND